MFDKPIIVTFSGKARHGKDTALEIARQNLGEQGKKVFVTGYADYLKTILANGYGWNGKKDEAGRALLQRVGSEYRDKDPNFWVDHVINNIKAVGSEYDYILIRDARYPNEITRWADYGFPIHSIHVERLNFKNDLTLEQQNHSSENALDGFLFDKYIAAADLKNLETSIKKHLKEDKMSSPQVQTIIAGLEKGVKDIFKSEKYTQYLKIMSHFHRYSPFNLMLILQQNPMATKVAGFHTWKKDFDRSVVKGAKGIKILAPIFRKIEENMPTSKEQPISDDAKRVVVGYTVKHVFDVSQTEGKPLPTLGINELTGNVSDYKKFFAAIENASPVPISFEKISSGAKGYFSLTDKRIVINEDMSEAQTVKTSLHEVAHAKLHDIDKNSSKNILVDHNIREVEAESVAYTVCRHFGIDTSDYSFAYIASWSTNREVEELKASLHVIQKTANELIEAIGKSLEKEQEIVPSEVAEIIQKIKDDVVMECAKVKGYTNQIGEDTRLVHLTDKQAEIAISLRIPIGLKGTHPGHHGSSAGLYNYNILDIDDLSRLDEIRASSGRRGFYGASTPSIHPSLPYPEKMYEYIKLVEEGRFSDFNIAESKSVFEITTYDNEKFNLPSSDDDLASIALGQKQFTVTASVSPVIQNKVFGIEELNKLNQMAKNIAALTPDELNKFNSGLVTTTNETFATYTIAHVDGWSIEG